LPRRTAQIQLNTKNQPCNTTKHDIQGSVWAVGSYKPAQG